MTEGDGSGREFHPERNFAHRPTTPRLSSNESQFVLRLPNPTRLLFSHGVSAWKFKKGWKLSDSSFSLAIPFACSGFEASEGSPIRLASHQSEPDRGQVSTESIATGGPGNVSHDHLFSANSSLRFEKSPPWSRGVRNRFYLLRGTCGCFAISFGQ